MAITAHALIIAVCLRPFHKWVHMSQDMESCRRNIKVMTSQSSYPTKKPSKFSNNTCQTRPIVHPKDENDITSGAPLFLFYSTERDMEIFHRRFLGKGPFAVSKMGMHLPPLGAWTVVYNLKLQPHRSCRPFSSSLYQQQNFNCL